MMMPERTLSHSRLHARLNSPRRWMTRRRWTFVLVAMLSIVINTGSAGVVTSNQDPPTEPDPAAVTTVPPAAADTLSFPTLSTITLRGDYRIFDAQVLPEDPDRLLVIAAYQAINVWAVIFSAWPEMLGIVGALVILRVIVRTLRQKRKPGSLYCRRCNYQLTPEQKERCPECGYDLERRGPAKGTPVRMRLAVLSFAFIGVIATASFWNHLEPPSQRPANHLFNWSSIRLRDWAYHRPFDLLRDYRTPVDRVLEIDAQTGAVKKTWFNEIAGTIPIRVTPRAGTIDLLSSPRMVSWNTQTGQRRADVVFPMDEPDPRWVVNFGLSPDASRVAAVLDDGRVMTALTDDPTWTKSFTINAGSNGIRSAWVLVNDDGHLVEIPQRSRRTLPIGRVRDTTGRVLHEFVLRVGFARSVCVTPDHASVLITDETQTIEMRSLADGTLEDMFIFPHRLVMSLSPAMTERFVIAGTWPSDGTSVAEIMIYDRAHRRVISAASLGRGLVRSVHANDDLSRLVVVFEQYAGGRQVHQVLVLDGSGLEAWADAQVETEAGT